MSNTVSVDDQGLNSSRPNFDSAAQDTEATALGSAAGEKIRAAVARQPGLATLLAMITGALVMTILRNQVTKRTAFSSRTPPRRRQASMKKAS